MVFGDIPQPRCSCGELVSAPHAECLAIGGGWAADLRKPSGLPKAGDQ